MDDMEQLVGHWAEIRCGSIDGFGSLPAFSFGFVEEVTEYALLLRKHDGEVLFLPLSTVQSARIVDPEDTSEAGRLLRPASAPDSDRLLRPAAEAGQTDPKTLLRPGDSQE